MTASIDAVGPAGGVGAAVNSAGPLTWTHVCAAGSTCLVVAVANNAGSDTGLTMAATYNGVAMTPVPSSIIDLFAAGLGFSQLFSLANPPSGSHTVSVTTSGGTTVAPLVGGSLSFLGSAGAPTNVTTATGNSATAAITVASASGDIACSFVSGASALTGHTQTLSFENNFSTSPPYNANVEATTAAGAATVAFSHSLLSQVWAIIGWDIAAAAAASSPMPQPKLHTRIARFRASSF